MIPISNDKLPENKENFLLSLSTPVNGTLTNSNATITIDSNDEIGFIVTGFLISLSSFAIFSISIAISNQLASPSLAK